MRILVLALLLFPALASATPQRMPDPTPELPDRIGTVNDLPVGCRFSAQELEDWARTQMPAVQLAMREFERRGYVRAAGGDTALNGCRFGNVQTSVVMLAYKKPGAFIDSLHLAWPAILVTTRTKPSTTESHTTVSGGMVVVSENRVEVGDAYFPNDRSFDVPHAGGRRGVMPEGHWYDHDSQLSRWARCTGWGTIACVSAAIRFGGPVYTGLKLAALYTAPELALGVLMFCFTGSGIGCFGSL